jgi:hypothetical protein
MQTEIEKKGIPSVSMITTPFTKDAQAAAELFGIPKVRKIVIPHPIANLSEKEVEERIKAVSGEIIQSLTLPLMEEEKETGVLKARHDAEITFRGHLAEVQDYYAQSGMTDGLPVIPPTEDRLREMLKGTSHRADEVIGQMPPEKWNVTVEKVAINGIMAGCLPEHMPVLLAITEALMDPALGVDSAARSTNSFAFWAMVNGPYAELIGMNAQGNALGPGNRANAVIGRAIRLILTNLGGSSPGLNDMSSQGNALKYGFSFAENEKESPWMPYHVERGYKPEESTVTLFRGMGFRTTDRSIGVGEVGLESIVWTSKNIGGVFGYSPTRGIVLLLDPLLAKQLADKGYSKQDIKEYLWLSLRWSVKEWKQSYSYTVDLRSNLYPKWYVDLPDHVMIPKFLSADRITVLVVGGQNNPVYQIYEAVSPGEGVTKSIDKWK